MKHVILLVCAVFALTTVSFAQNAPTAPAPAKTKEMKAKGKAQGKEMKEEGKEKGKEAGEKGKGQMGASLGLSPDQQAKYGAVNKAHQEAVRKVQMDATLSADAKKTQVNALKSKYEADVKGVMNADQYTKWSEGRAKRAAEKGEHKEEHKGEHKGEKMGEHKPKANKEKAPPKSGN